MNDPAFTIRTAGQHDAEALLTCLSTLDNETQYLLLEPDERRTTVDTQRTLIQDMEENPRNLLLVAATPSAIVGYLGAKGGRYRRNQHVLSSLSLGVLNSYQRRGVGRSLISRAIKWARTQDFKRIEFTSHAENHAATKLYLSLGFQVEGTRRNALSVDDRLVDELWMSKLL